MRHLPALLALVLILAPGFVRAEDEEEERFDPEGAAQAVAEGDSAREARRWADAADLYWKAIEADRRHFTAHVRYQAVSREQGVALADLKADYDSFLEDLGDDLPMRLHRLRLEEVEGRVKELEAIRRKHRNEPAVSVELARAYLATGEDLKGIRLLDPIAGPDSVLTRHALVLLVRAQVRAGKGAKVREALEAAVAAQPADLELRLEAARLALMEGRHPECLVHIDVVLGDRRTSTPAYLIKGEALYRTNRSDPSAAIATLKTGEVATEGSPAILIALGDLIGRFGGGSEEMLAEAASYYQKVLDVDAEHTSALYGMAWVRERELKFAEAEKLYRKVAGMLPSDPSCVESVGYVLFKQGRISDAQIQFKKAIDMDSTYASAYANYGATLDAKAEYGEAIEWYEKLLKMKGQEDNLRAIINLAFDYEQLASFSKAEKFLRHAHELQPLDADIMVWLADNLYFQEKWKSAERTYHEALSLDEKSYYGWRGLGLTLGQLQKWSDAAAAFEKAKAIKLEPDLILMLAGIYLDELKDSKLALENFELYIQAGGDDPYVPELIVELRKELAGKR